MRGCALCVCVCVPASKQTCQGAEEVKGACVRNFKGQGNAVFHYLV